MTLTFSPPIGPSFDLPIDQSPRIEATPRGKGYQATRPIGLRPLRSYRLQWVTLTEAEKAYLASFFHEVGGEPFYWTPPAPEDAPEHRGPTLEAVTSGALGARTVYVAFSWHDSDTTGETTLSPESSISTSSGEVVKVSVPVFPTMADRVRIYAGTSSGSLTLQATSSARAWTEPDTGLVAGASPPSSNTLSRPLLFTLVSGPTFRLYDCRKYRAELELVETIAP